jgi:hypothetical protein
MKCKLFAVIVLLPHIALADQSGTQAVNPAAVVDESVLRTNAALKSYNEEYLQKPLHKAFAQSPDGGWSWRGDRVTIEMAMEDALNSCNKVVRKNESPCEVINVDGEWVTPKK